ncbi:hypothetical protein KTH81_03665 [Lachnospiraceae bacterium ASD3451]|uniref:Zinc finger LSD1-type domain-containing protein n=1 Tax=Diplocloster agilis TaxID=2850323 RepID=A0A949K361_9FIRM|nr:hypothetical protein [Diplocloster agilis]MBU9742910.1 hypothetical protein [Diplocloster agilis]
MSPFSFPVQNDTPDDVLFSAYAYPLFLSILFCRLTLGSHGGFGRRFFPFELLPAQNRGCRTNLALFLGASHVRCLGLGTAGGIRGRSGRPGSFVSPWERIGRLRIRLVKSESRVQDARRTSRPTGKSL